MEYNIIVKEGVVFRQINKFTIEFFHALDNCCKTYGHNYVITSANDGHHSAESYHFKHLAFDIRLNDLPKSQWYVLQTAIKAALGNYWDILVENTDSPTNVHLHCEMDMKKYSTYFLNHNGSEA